jgi:hypothetical protein
VASEKVPSKPVFEEEKRYFFYKIRPRVVIDAIWHLFIFTTAISLVFVAKVILMTFKAKKIY